MLVFLEEKQSSFAGFLRTQPWENVLLIVEDWLLRIHKYALNLKKKTKTNKLILLISAIHKVQD